MPSSVGRIGPDPLRGPFNALVGGLDVSTVVVEAFHVVRLANPRRGRCPRPRPPGTKRSSWPRCRSRYGIRRVLESIGARTRAAPGSALD